MGKSKKVRTSLVLFILVMGLAGTAGATGGEWGPWSVSAVAPAITLPADREAPPAKGGDEPPAVSVSATPFLWLLAGYQTGFGAVSRGRCNMEPTCSNYSLQAIRKHGPLMGIAMTGDRLIHESSEKEHAPQVLVGDRFRWRDRVEDNDFWWSSK